MVNKLCKENNNNMENSFLKGKKLLNNQTSNIEVSISKIIIKIKLLKSNNKRNC